MVKNIVLFFLAAALAFLVYTFYKKTQGPMTTLAKGSSASNPGPLPVPSTFPKSQIYYDTFGETWGYDPQVGWQTVNF